eukprot:4318198-Pyramimonas_sp.AAC.1
MPDGDDMELQHQQAQEQVPDATEVPAALAAPAQPVIVDPAARVKEMRRDIDASKMAPMNAG